MTYLNILHFLSTYAYSDKIIFVIVSILVVVLIIDTSVNKIYYFTFNQSPLGWRVFLFIGVSSVSLVGLHLISRFVKQRSEHIRNRKLLHTNELDKIVMISQFLLTAIIIFVILQITIMSHYNVILLTSAAWISYITAITMMGILTQKFFSWFKTNRNSTVFLYGLSSVMVVINAVFIITFLSATLNNASVYARPHIGTGYPFFNLGPVTDILNFGYVISSILSFMLWWIATISVLRHYSQKSKKRYWFILIIPLVYFLVQFQPLFVNLFSSFLASDPVSFSITYTLIFTISKPVGGILFSIAFWAVARKIQRSNAVRNYIIISAYGLVLLFVSNQGAILASAPYPPFGLATVSFMGLASYLILVGIYSSAISVSEDSKLRKSIRNFAMNEAKLVDSIGTAEMEQEIQRRVIDMTKVTQDIMTEETGVQPSLNEEDIKQYLLKVIEEVKAVKKEDDNI